MSSVVVPACDCVRQQPANSIQLQHRKYWQQAIQVRCGGLLQSTHSVLKFRHCTSVAAAKHVLAQVRLCSCPDRTPASTAAAVCMCKQALVEHGRGAAARGAWRGEGANNPLDFAGAAVLLAPQPANSIRVHAGDTGFLGE